MYWINKDLRYVNSNNPCRISVVISSSNRLRFKTKRMMKERKKVNSHGRT